MGKILLYIKEVRLLVRNSDYTKDGGVQCNFRASMNTILTSAAEWCRKLNYSRTVTIAETEMVEWFYNAL